AAELAVLGGVDVLVQAGLDDIGTVLEILQQILLGRVDQFDAGVLAEVGTIDQQLESAPGRFQGLETRVMENLVHLLAELAVDLGNHAIDHGLLHRLLLIVGLEQFLDEGGHTPPGDAVGFVFGAQAGLGDDAVENAVVGGLPVVVERCLCVHGRRRLIQESCCWVWGRASSSILRYREASSPSTLSMAVRKAGALPRGPFSATRASGCSINWRSSGTCCTRLGG